MSDNVRSQTQADSDPAPTPSVSTAENLPADDPQPSAGASTAARRRVSGKGVAVATRVKTGTAANLWSRLNAVDFMNSAMQFSATVLLCIFPLLVVVSDLLGKDVRKVIVTRMGLNQQAAADVDGLISSGNQAVQGLTVLGIVFLVLCALGFASTLQSWYEKVYDQPTLADWKKQLRNRAIWVVGFAVNFYLLVVVGSQTGPAGGKVLIFACELVISVIFWWWSLQVLLLGRASWRALFPAGLATALCLTGLGVFSALLFSSSVISDENSYGPIGVVMVLLSYCIGFGVCLHLGAVIGRMWNERCTPIEEMS